MGIEEILGNKREKIHRIADKHGVTSMRVYGPVARGEAGMDTEIDLLIENGPNTTPWFPGGFVADMEELLGRRVHVAWEDALPPYAQYIAEDAVPL